MLELVVLVVVAACPWGAGKGWDWRGRGREARESACWLKVLPLYRFLEMSKSWSSFWEKAIGSGTSLAVFSVCILDNSYGNLDKNKCKLSVVKEPGGSTSCKSSVIKSDGFLEPSYGSVISLYDLSAVVIVKWAIRCCFIKWYFWLSAYEASAVHACSIAMSISVGIKEDKIINFSAGEGLYIFMTNSSLMNHGPGADLLYLSIIDVI